MRAPRSAAARLSVVAGLLCALLAGCGGGAPPEPGPGPPVVPIPHHSRLADLERAVATRVAADRTAATSTSGTVPGRSGEPVALPAAEGAVSLGRDGTAAHAHLPLGFADGEPGLLEAVVRTDDTAWVRAPGGLGRDQPAGKPWFGPIQLAETFSGTVEQKLAVLATRAVRAAEPTRAWRSDLYGDGAALVSALDEDLDGVPTVKYRITVDIARAAAGQDDARRKRALQGYLEQGEATNEIAVWVDADDRPLRVQQRVGSGERATVVDIRYRDWGEPVRIEPPPADEVDR